MKKMKSPFRAIIAIAIVLLVMGPSFTVQETKACESDQIWVVGTRFLWTCVGTNGNDCGWCKDYEQ